jgi:hypothetical protein
MRQIWLSFFVAFALLGVANISNADLQSRLDGLAYYDTDLDITWAADANMTGIYVWENQANAVAALEIGGVTGWRLPSHDEMDHLFSEEGVSASVPGPFTNFAPAPIAWYWTGTEVDPDTAWRFHMDTGVGEATDKSTDGFGMAVYDGDVAPVVGCFISSVLE